MTVVGSTLHNGKQESSSNIYITKELSQDNIKLRETAIVVTVAATVN